MTIYTMKVTFIKMPDVDVFLFWNVKIIKVDLMVNIKMAISSPKFVLKNTSLEDLSIALNFIFIFQFLAYVSFTYFRVRG